MFKKIVGLALVSVVLLSVPCSALQVRTGENIIVPAGTVINDNLFVAGSNIEVAGTINGDLIAFGSNIEIDAYVAGNIMVGGSDVDIKGSARNVYVGGSNVELAGTVRKDLLVGSGNVELGQTARVWKDAYLGCGNARVAGKIYRDLKVGAGKVAIVSGAYVQGRLDHSAENIDISKQARVVGPITSYVSSAPEKGGRFLGGFFGFARLISLLAILLLGSLIIVFLPNQVKLVTGQMKDECWKSFFLGILSLVVIPLAAILLCVTLIGIPLAIVLLAVYAFGIYITAIFVSVVIGKWVLDKLGKTKLSLIWALVLGLVILNVVGLVPVLGWIAGLILFLWGFGALVLTRFTSYKNARSKGVI
ncbi:hypothetical protein ACFL37_02460 [Candidatus Margulisiibacteriota bacterium]